MHALGTACNFTSSTTITHSPEDSSMGGAFRPSIRKQRASRSMPREEQPMSLGGTPLSRGMKGTYVYFLDQATRNHFEEALFG
jgi:DUF2075 family protein